MSCFYKRMLLMKNWKCVALNGETCNNSASFCHRSSPTVTIPCCTSFTELENHNNGNVMCKQEIPIVADMIKSKSNKPLLSGKDVNKYNVTKNSFVYKVDGTELNGTCNYLYEGLPICESCLYQKTKSASTSSFKKSIEKYLTPSFTPISSLHDRIHPKHTRHKSDYCSSILRSNCVHFNNISSSGLLNMSLFQCTKNNLSVQNKFLDICVNQVRGFTKSIVVNEEDLVTTSDIQKFLAASGMKFEQGYTCFISSCPKVAKQKVQNKKLYINKTTGHFLCEYCHNLGGWPELKDNISLLTKHKRKKDYDCFKDVESVQKLDFESRQVGEMWMHGKSVGDLSEDDFSQIVEDFDCEKLTVSTMNKYGVSYDISTRALLFPIFNMHSVVSGISRILLKVSEDDIIKTTKDVLPRTGPVGLFGWNTISADTTTVVMTTSVMDAMSVYQETKVHAVALPKGYSVLPQELLPSLEQFKKIILWFGDDIRAWEAAKQFAKKLGNKRCFVIRPSSDDPSPYKALLQDLKLKNILSKAKPIGHKSIVSFTQLRQEIFSELAHVEQVAGVKWRRFPALNRILKGHRRGELTVFTGPTGSGKTTFISDYSLDLCMQGVNTLWGSFEINNVRLGKMMLTQFARMNLSKHLDQFDVWANLFEELPMYFMTFQGQENIRNVVETMSHAVYVHDIAHVVLDNLQFMMGTNEDWVDKFTRQDMIISSFRKFATRMNCHVTLVIHPRKEREQDDLTTASIFGSAKATQEADNVLILQDKRLHSVRGNKYLQITKNRFDGELGIMLLKFDKEAVGFSVRDKVRKKDDVQKEEVQKEEVQKEEVQKEEVQSEEGRKEFIKTREQTGGDWFTK